MLILLILLTIISLTVGIIIAITPDSIPFLSPIALIVVMSILPFMWLVMAIEHGQEISIRKQEIGLLYIAVSGSCTKAELAQFNEFQDLHPDEYHTPLEWNNMYATWKMSKAPIEACQAQDRYRIEGAELFQDNDWYKNLH